MEKVFKNMKNASPMPIEAKKVLLLNADHAIFAKMRELFNTDHGKLKKYITLLYTRAMITEGFEVEDMAGYFSNVCELMTK
jgi:molecular chaperone HtpG